VTICGRCGRTFGRDGWAREIGPVLALYVHWMEIHAAL
jgi:hypothetical protein